MGFVRFLAGCVLLFVGGFVEHMYDIHSKLYGNYLTAFVIVASATILTVILVLTVRSHNRRNDNRLRMSTAVGILLIGALFAALLFALSLMGAQLVSIVVDVATVAVVAGCFAVIFKDWEFS